MRQIGHIPNEGQARVFRAFLKSRGIASDVDQNRDGNWAVWVHDESHLDDARERLGEFVADPKSDRYQTGAKEGEQREREEAKAGKKQKSRVVDMRTQWHLSRVSGGVLTKLLIFMSIMGAMLVQMEGTSEAIRGLFSISSYTISGGYLSYRPGLYDVMHGQVWRLITPIFLHFGLLHILFNGLWLWQLGGAVEAVSGTKWLAAHVAVYAIAGNVGQYFLSGPSFGGMSGVNYGLFMYVWIVGKYRAEERFHIDPMTAGLMIFWFFACLFGWISNVANGAHAAGLVLGTLWAAVAIRQIPFTRVRF